MSQQSSESATHSRRDILRASAVIAGGAMASSFIVQNAHAASNDTIKIGLIGCGGRGTGACGQALSTEGPVELVAVADAFADQAQNAVESLKNKFADRPERVKVTADTMFVGWDAYKKVIDSGIDLVVIATPPGFRPIHFEYAVQQGKNIFAEKPIATDPPGVKRFLAAVAESKKKNLKVGIGLQRHHEAPYLDAVKRIQDGALGKLMFCRAYWDGTRPWVRARATALENKRKIDPNATLSEMEYQMRNWYYFTWLCGDHIVEQHIHNLDVINWIMNDHPISAQGVGGKQVDTGIDSGQIFDHHMVEFTYKDGTKMLSECRQQNGCWNSISEHAHGTLGAFGTEPGGIHFTMADGTTWKSKAKGKDPYQQEHDDLFHAVRNDQEYNEGEYGAHSTMTAILGRMATYSGQILQWDQAMKKGLNIMPKEYAWDAEPPVMPDANGKYPVAMPGITKVMA